MVNPLVVGFEVSLFDVRRSKNKVKNHAKPNPSQTNTV